MAWLAATSDPFLDIILWTAVAIGLLLLLWVVWLWLRKWYFGGHDTGADAVPWSLEQLRELKQQGELSEEEYEQLRRQVIEQYADTGEDRSADPPRG